MSSLTSASKRSCEQLRNEHTERTGFHGLLCMKIYEDSEHVKAFCASACAASQRLQPERTFPPATSGPDFSHAGRARLGGCPGVVFSAALVAWP